LDNSPAQQAGLQPGDVILKVNGEDVSERPLFQVVQHILGPAGTTVTLTILTPSTGNTRDVTITRAKITVRNVTWQQVPGTTIADVRIAEFSKGVSQDLQQALTEIKNQKLTGIILDLRNDPGGLLDEATGVVSEFVANGNVLEEQDATGKITPVPVEHKYPVIELPMAVLINQGSASAAEITAGALQDDGRATLIGDTTFGTGTVLNDFNLPDGSALLLAVQEWLTPKGRVIWHHGITPDDQVSLPANAHPLLPEAERSMTPDQVKASDDQQLLHALELLNSATTRVAHLPG
jgi:carboxyl-terminal processing protease